jgi:hypothetical protein
LGRAVYLPAIAKAAMDGAPQPSSMSVDPKQRGQYTLKSQPADATRSRCR